MILLESHILPKSTYFTWELLFYLKANQNTEICHQKLWDFLPWYDAITSELGHCIHYIAQLDQSKVSSHLGSSNQKRVLLARFISCFERILWKNPLLRPGPWRILVRHVMFDVKYFQNCVSLTRTLFQLILIVSNNAWRPGLDDRKWAWSLWINHCIQCLITRNTFLWLKDIHRVTYYNHNQHTRAKYLK